MGEIFPKLPVAGFRRIRHQHALIFPRLLALLSAPVSGRRKAAMSMLNVGQKMGELRPVAVGEFP